MFTLSCIAALMWLGLLCVPWRPWSTREQLHVPPAPGVAPADLGAVTVLIPARDEARCIAETLAAVAAQGPIAAIILIDDQSSDDTAAVAAAVELEALTIVQGSTPPPGWSGKLWALQQGYERANTPLLLLLDADIELQPGTLSALCARQRDERLALVSVMASLHMHSALERLLLPPFIYFFKLIYPFALANDPASRVAAAAGGCILIEKARLDSVGGFSALHDAIIDDCSLAGIVKRSGGRTWLGLSHAVRAIRPYSGLGEIWNMVARSAFTQLHYSLVLLLTCSALLLVSFVVPVLALGSGGAETALGITALFAMGLTYLPTLRYYNLPLVWSLTLPLAAGLFLAMTWHSALRYWSGERSRWKNRSYQREVT